MVPLLDRTELLLPWLSQGLKGPFSTRVHVFTARGQPYLSSVSQQNEMSPRLVFLYLLLRSGLGFEHKEITTTHRNGNISQQQ
jgi:hypothetical protein